MEDNFQDLGATASTSQPVKELEQGSGVSSCEMKTNAKGQITWTIKCYDEDFDKAVERCLIKAEKLHAQFKEYNDTKGVKK